MSLWPGWSNTGLFLLAHSWVTSYNLLWNEQDLAAYMSYLMGNITNKIKRNGYKAVVFVTWICQELTGHIIRTDHQTGEWHNFFFFISFIKYRGDFIILTLIVTESLGWISARDHVGLPWWSSGEDSARYYRGHGFDPYSGRIAHAEGQLNLHASIAKDCTTARK